jgi:hypothetical protein
VAGLAEDAGGKVSESRHDVRAGAGPGGGDVLAVGDIADPVELVFDLPVPADPGRELVGPGLADGQRPALRRLLARERLRGRETLRRGVRAGQANLDHLTSNAARTQATLRVPLKWHASAVEVLGSVFENTP